MNKEEIIKFLEPLDKNTLRKLIKQAEKKLNSTLGIGDSVTLVIDYMIGDADGNTEQECTLEIKSEDDLKALNIVQDILKNHTKPNKGTWGFILNEESFSKKPDDVYNLLYNQDEAPNIYNNIEITPNILETISCIVDECFTGETEYSFLVYQGNHLEQ